MSAVKRFEDLPVWQSARELAKCIGQLTMTGSLSKDFSLKDQMRRSSGSIMDNIAEDLNAMAIVNSSNSYPLQKDQPGNLDLNSTVQETWTTSTPKT
jgi:hypothetical protein